MLLKSARRQLAVISCGLFIAGLAACGGGGGGSSNGGGGGNSGGTGTLALSLSTTNVTFGSQAPNFGLPAPQLLIGNVTGTGSGTLYVIITPNNPAIANVANVVLGAGGGTADIVPGNPAALGLGTHTTTITIRACVNDASCSRNQIAGSPQTINVSYIVSGVLPSMTSLNYTIGNSFIAADLTRTFDVGAYPVSGWIATTDVPMLHVAPVNGGSSLSTAVTASIDSASVDEFESGTYTGVIRLLPNVLVPTPTDIPVSVDIHRTRVNYVAPYVAESGRANDVIIRGEGFDLAPPTGVKFGGVDAVSYAVVSSTEIHARHPALAAGVYPVHVVNAQGIDRTSADLHVVPPTAYPAAVVQYPDGAGVFPFSLIYDSERQAVFLNIVYNLQGADTNQLVRFAYSNGAWQFTGRIFVPYRSAFALTTDGRRLLYAHAPTTPGGPIIEELDPVTLATLKSVSWPFADYEAFQMAVANDGNVLIEEESSQLSGGFPEIIYRPRRNNIEQLYNPLQSNPLFRMDSGGTAGSGDGSLVLVSQYQYSRAAKYVSGSLQTAWASDNFYFDELLSINRRGTLMLASFIEAWDGDFNQLGRTPNSTRSATVAPELPRIYTVDQDDLIHIFDTSQPAVNNMLVETGTPITAAASPNGSGGESRMTVSQDGHTLFIATRDQLLVQPLP